MMNDMEIGPTWPEADTGVCKGGGDWVSKGPRPL